LLGDNNRRLDELEIEIVSGEDGALTRLYGRINIDSSPTLRDHLLALLEAPHPKVVGIDLSAVTHIDSSGVATLIEALKVARSHDTEVRLQGLEGRVLRLFQSTGILSLFNGRARTNTQPGTKAV